MLSSPSMWLAATLWAAELCWAADGRCAEALEQQGSPSGRWRLGFWGPLAVVLPSLQFGNRHSQLAVPRPPRHLFCAPQATPGVPFREVCEVQRAQVRWSGGVRSTQALKQHRQAPRGHGSGLGSCSFPLGTNGWAVLSGSWSRHIPPLLASLWGGEGGGGGAAHSPVPDVPPATIRGVLPG